MRHRTVLLLAVLLAAAFAPPFLAQGGRANTAASPIVFNGLLVQDGVTKVSLHNPNTGDTKWVVVGQKFGSYTVGFQPGVPGQTADAVVLTLGASSQRIILQGSADLSAAGVAAATALKTALADALARARSAPNSDPGAIGTLEWTLKDAQSATAVGNYRRVTFSTADGGGQQTINVEDTPILIINNVTGAANSYSHGSSKRNPDGSLTWTLYDASGRVLSVSTPPAPNPAAPATSPAAAK